MTLHFAPQNEEVGEPPFTVDQLLSGEVTAEYWGYMKKVLRTQWMLVDDSRADHGASSNPAVRAARDRWVKQVNNSWPDNKEVFLVVCDGHEAYVGFMDGYVLIQLKA